MYMFVKCQITLKHKLPGQRPCCTVCQRGSNRQVHCQAAQNNNGLHLGSITNIRMLSGPICCLWYSHTLREQVASRVWPRRFAKGPKASSSPYLIFIYQVPNVWLIQGLVPPNPPDNGKKHPCMISLQGTQYETQGDMRVSDKEHNSISHSLRDLNTVPP